jgi:hypothetical protein
MAAVLLTPSADPVIVTVTDWFTEEESTLNPAEFAPLWTCTDAGTCKALLLLLRDTETGLVAAAVKITEHDLDCEPTRDCVPQEICDNVAPALEGVPERELVPLNDNPPHPDNIATAQPNNSRETPVWLLCL